MAEKYFRYVFFERVNDYLKLGWMIADELNHPVLSESILLVWPCNCEIKEPNPQSFF